MPDFEQLRDDLDSAYDDQRSAEDAVLGQRRRDQELGALKAEERSTNQALSPTLRGGRR